MLGLIGIIVSLLLLIVLAYRGINVLVLAPIMALVAALFASQPLLATYTQVFMPALGKYAITYFPLFLLGAIFGKVMDDSGSAKSIASFIVDKVGAHRAILAIVLACGILTYGGVSLFVVAFAVFPIAAALFKQAELPKRLIPAAIALGSFTFTMTALPGTPAIQNAIPNPYFGTNAFAAPGLGLIGGAIMFIGGMLWFNRRAASLRAAGELYDNFDEIRSKRSRKGDDASAASVVAVDDASGTGGHGRGHHHHAGFEGVGGEGTATSDPKPLVATKDQEDPALAERPHVPVGLAFLPIFIVIGLNYALVNWIFPNMDFAYLQEEAYGSTTIKSVSGIWGIIVALVVAIATVLALNFSRMKSARESVNEGTMGSLLPIFNTASEVGYGAVIASLPAFTMVKDAVLGVSSNPVVSLGLSVNVLAGITGSASGGMSIALEALGQEFRTMAEEQGISLELMHRVTAMASGGFDSLPHNGAVITLLAICGLTHRKSYKDIGVVSVVIPLIALVVVIALGSTIGSF